MQRELEVPFTDEQLALIRREAKSKNIPVEQAAKQFFFRELSKALRSGCTPPMVSNLQMMKKLH